MEYQEYNENESTIFDDDEYINDCSSLKRKMTILEKIAIIISSVLCFPMGIFFCNLIPGKLQSYIELAEMPQNILFLFTWLLSFFILMFQLYSIIIWCFYMPKSDHQHSASYHPPKTGFFNFLTSTGFFNLLLTWPS